MKINYCVGGEDKNALFRVIGLFEFREGMEMKKIIISILILLFIFAFIRITTSTYENLKRNAQLLPILEEKL